MRIAVVSDIHGNLPALEAVMRDIARRSVEQVVNLGDSLSGPLLPRETAQLLMATGWVHLAGNHERQLLTQSVEEMSASDAYAHSRLTAHELDWMRSLSPSLELTRDVYLCHATPTSDMQYFLETVEPGRTRAATLSELDLRLADVTAPLVLCGHSHVPRAMRASSGQLIVNPGSVGLPGYDASRPYPHVMATGSPDARYAIVESVSDDWAVQLITVPYAHRAMAELAASRNRPDWARALATGHPG